MAETYDDESLPFALQQAGLLRKYRELCRKYDDLVQKYDGLVEERYTVQRLARWSLRLLETGAALVQGGAITASNARFDELSNRRGGDVWCSEAAGASEHGTLRELVIREAAAVAESDSGTVSERRYRRTGVPLWIDVRSERIGLPSQPTMVAVLVSDVTRRMQIEGELEHTRELLVRQERLRALGEVGAGVAHDLNNVFNAMMLRLGGLQDHPAIRSEAGRELDAVARMLEDATSLVRRVQDLTLDGAGAGVVPTRVDVSQVVTEAVDLVRPELERHARHGGSSCRIECELEPVSAVLGVAAELRRVFVNLLLNARDAMPDGGPIAVHSGPTSTGDGVCVTVADGGSGFGGHPGEKLFEPFFTTKGAAGTGLGLSIARSIVEHQGGTITAHENEPRGAVFTVFLPFERDAPPA